MVLGYERLCRSLHSYAKTTQQIKLLWSTIINKVGTSPDNISSLLVSKTWKELCNDSRYSHICHYEEILIDNIEKTLNRYSNSMKYKQINLKHANNINTSYNYNNNFNINNNMTSINNNKSFNQIQDKNGIYDSNSNNNNNNNNNSKWSIICITDINNINNNNYSNNNNNDYVNNQQDDYQNYSTISYFSSPISSEYPNHSLKNNQYIIYNNPVINNGNTQKSNLLSPTNNSISFTNYNNDINNVNQNNIPITITATTYVDTTPQYLSTPKADQIQKPVSFVQPYVTVPNISQNNVIYYYK